MILKAILSIPVLLVLALAPLTCAESVVGGDDWKDFLAAEAALERGDLEHFEALASGLANHPLYPYLQYGRLSRYLGSVDSESIADFLLDHGETPLSGRLRRAWLDRLAKEGRLDEYVRFYVPDDSITRRCHYLHGLLLGGRRDDVLDQVEPLWLQGKSLPDVCDPLLDAWKQAGRLTSDLVWQRIALAMAAGELGLARYLGESLAAQERTWLDRWLAIHRDPRRVRDTERPAGEHPFRIRILTHGVVRLTREEPRQAADAWDRLARELAFPADQAQLANAAIGFALAEGGDRRGLSYLDRIAAGEDNIKLQERRLRTALKLGYWDGVADWIAAMPSGQLKSEHWLYWQARAAAIGGNAEKAQILFDAAARERSLWGFLAAERVGRPYKIGGASTPADPKRIEVIEQSAAATRIRELEAFGRKLDARREWHWLTRDMGREDLMAAAVIAQRRGWQDRAIFTLAKSGYWDDLEIRFPLLHRDIVRDQADATGLDESWIYAVLRQESAFNPKALSQAGAIGLMQLMPATAREVAQSLVLAPPSRNRLYEPRLNITLGSTYLARMHRRFGGNPVLATAAYNAGPGNVDRWLPERRTDADVWIATIPWRETRGYVRRVLAYRSIYAHRLGDPVEPLHGIMQPIGREGDRNTE